jgi:hypothetical protein
LGAQGQSPQQLDCDCFQTGEIRVKVLIGKDEVNGAFFQTKQNGIKKCRIIEK